MTYHWKQKPNKYGAIRTEVDGITFMSKGEATRFLYLKLRQKAGEIRDLELQPCYSIEINGKHICKVYLDFRYFDIALNQVIIEDYKGIDNNLSKIKRLLAEAQHGIKVTIV